jgi:3-methyladenine DNA glycosylase AlkD
VTFDVNAAADELEDQLRRLISAERGAKQTAYRKSPLEFIGVTVPLTRAAAKTMKRWLPSLTHDEIARLAWALSGKPVHERRVATVEVLTLYREALVASDIEWLEGLLREAGTWALVDPLAATVVGGLVERHPRLG